MKLPELTKRTSAGPSAARWLAASLLIVLFAIPSQAFAQCSGNVDIEFPGAVDLNGNGVPDYLLSELPESVNWALTPKRGGGLDIDVDFVRFGLSCFNNGDEVPCASGNDALPGTPPQPTPLQFTSLSGGTCGASVFSDSNGIVVFQLGELLLGDAGCTIDFSTSLLGLGTDGSPNFITQAVAFDGLCSDGALSGSAAGSAALEIVDPAIEVTKTGPTTAKVGDEFLYTISFTVLSDPEVLGTCTLTDPTLGINQVVVADTPYEFPYTPQAGDPNPLDNIATVTCDVTDAEDQVVTTIDDDDDWTVDLIDPAIAVTKTGPDTAKVGDEFDYTIRFTATSDGAALGECRLNDTLLEVVDQVVLPDTDYTFPYTPAADGPNPLLNTAFVDCDITGFTNKAEADDSWSVNVIGPAIEVTKTGPDTAKVGDEFDYTIRFTATSDGAALGECRLNDALLEVVDQVVLPDTDYTFPYTPAADGPNPLDNTAFVDCDITGFTNKAEADDSWSVDVINPAIEVTKTGPEVAKVGDEFDYTIRFTATSDGAALGECRLNDALLEVVDQVVLPDTDYTFPYTPAADGPNPLDNTAFVDCDITGFTNKAEADDSWSVDTIDPGVSLTKECSPDPVLPGETIDWVITVNNTGDIELDCVVNDVTAGFNDEPVVVAVGGSETLNASRTVVPGDAPVISNTADVVCPIPGFTNQVDDEATADCEVVVVDEICRTPGFWGTHAGVEKRKSTNLTQMVIDAAGGTLVICGEDVTNTLVPDNESATEAICVSPSGDSRLQLARHLTAAALNCVISGGGADCSGVSIGDDWTAANDACINEDTDDYSYLGGIIDDWNNSEPCHSRDLDDSDVFDTVDKLPGPAGSPKDCNKATSNDTTIFTPDP